jgi:YHS domain-containing protein
MVSDPQCHVYIPKHDAIKTKVAGKTLYFCSKECKKKYLKKEHEPQ